MGALFQKHTRVHFENIPCVTCLSVLDVSGPGLCDRGGCRWAAVSVAEQCGQLQWHIARKLRTRQVIGVRSQE